jgi:hypothetical protein
VVLCRVWGIVAKKKPVSLSADAKGFLAIAVGILGLFSLWSFQFLNHHANWLGMLGYWTALAAEYLFGLGAYLVPLYLFWMGAQWLKEKKGSLESFCARAASC